MFSSRISGQLTRNPLFTKLEKLRCEGSQILDLSLSNPTKAGLEYPREAFLGDLGGSECLEYDPDPKGLLKTRLAVCSYYMEKSIKIDPGSVFLTASTSEAYGMLFKLLCDWGGRVLYPSPGYPLFEYLGALEGVEMLPYRLEYLHPSGWHIDLEHVESQLKKGVKALILIHPGNPTGTCVRNNEREKLLDLCALYGTALISDEVFQDFPVSGTMNESFAITRDVLTFTLNGISKLLGMPQMKLGWICVSGPGRTALEAIERLEIITDTYLSVNAVVSQALPLWLDKRQLFINAVLGRLKKNYSELTDYCESGDFRLLTMQGGWTSIVQVPAIMSEEDWALGLLSEERVFCYPGYFFDMDKGAHLTVSLLTPTDTLKQGLRAISSFYERHTR